MTERLLLNEHLSAERTIELDLSLGLLDTVQIDAGREYTTLFGRHASETLIASKASPIWVPIALLSRDITLPDDVVNAVGVSVPRLTQNEIRPLLAAGLYGLLRTLLLSESGAKTFGHYLHRFLFTDYRAEWLVQAAILTLFSKRAGAVLKDTLHGLDRFSGNGRQADEDEGPEDLARAVLKGHNTLLREFFGLFDVALTEYLVIVGLDTSHDEHHLRFSAPLKSDQHDTRHLVRSRPRQLLAAKRGYQVTYETVLPATLRSYHLMAEVDPGLRIDQMVLSTDGDRTSTEQLALDLSYLAGVDQPDQTHARTDIVPPQPDTTQPQDEDPLRSSPDANIENERSGIRKKLFDLERRSSYRSLEDLVRRRRWDAENANGTLTRSVITDTVGPKVSGVLPGHNDEVNGSMAIPLGESDAARSAWLQEIAARLVGDQWAWDLRMITDPLTRRAHAHWRHDVPDRRRYESVSAKSSLIIKDAAEGSAHGIGIFILGVMVLTYAVASLLYKSPLFFEWPDKTKGPVRDRQAVIAVLLLVPGFLYSRLDLPSRTSIAARLRALPRLTAHIAIGSVAILCGFVASESVAQSLRWVFWAVLVLQFVSAIVIFFPTERIRGPDKPPLTRPWFEPSASSEGLLSRRRQAATSNDDRRTADVAYVAAGVAVQEGSSRSTGTGNGSSDMGVPGSAVRNRNVFHARALLRGAAGRALAWIRAARDDMPIGPGSQVPERGRARLSSPALADLARAGALLALHPVVEVAYEVHHLPDEPGYLFGLHAAQSRSDSPTPSRDLDGERSVEPPTATAPVDDTAVADLSESGIGQRSEDPDGEAPRARRPFFETICSGANGLGLVIQTWVRSIEEGGATTLAEGVSTSTTNIGPEKGLMWNGTAQPNPSFLYEWTNVVEGLIRVDAPHDAVTVDGSQALFEVLATIGSVASAGEATILFLQSPAQIPPSRDQQGGLPLRPAPGLAPFAVRFAIGLYEQGARERSKITRPLSEFCRVNRHDLWLNRFGPARRSGNWYHVVDSAALPSSITRATDGDYPKRVRLVCPVTFIIPSRRGSADAILRLFAAHRPAGVIGSSMVSLDDVDFIHLQVAVPLGKRASSLGDHLKNWASPAPVLAVAGVDRRDALLVRCVALLTGIGLIPDHAKIDKSLRETFRRDAGNAQILVGPVLAVKERNGSENGQQQLWISWDVERPEDGMAVPLRGLEAALVARKLLPGSTTSSSVERLAGSNLDYLICREMANNMLRAKGKLSIPLGRWPGGLAGAQTDGQALADEQALANEIEFLWRSNLAPENQKTFELSVALQENWLGHWSSMGQHGRSVFGSTSDDDPSGETKSD